MTDPEDDPWPPNPEFTNACPVCKAPPGFKCVRKGTRWYRAPNLKDPHPERMIPTGDNPVD